MASFIEKARKVIRENQDLLSVFEELDRTGKFRKRSYKKKMDFTIDEDLLALLRAAAKTQNKPMSRIVEDCLKEGLRKTPAKPL